MQRVGKTNVRFLLLHGKFTANCAELKARNTFFCIPVVPFWFAFVASQTEVCKPYLFSFPDFCFDTAVAASAREIALSSFMF